MEEPELAEVFVIVLVRVGEVFFFFWPGSSLWDLSSPTKDQTKVLDSESTKS